MRVWLTAWPVVTLGTPLTTGTAIAEVKMEIVESKLVWDQAPHSGWADVVRFNGRWFVACLEGRDGSFRSNPAVRILTSEDGTKWTSVGQLRSPQGKGLSAPYFSVTPGGKLMITSDSVVPSNVKVGDPQPQFGGTVRTLAWFSQDGKEWGGPDHVGPDDYPLGRVRWHKKTAYAYSHGCICGSCSTVAISSSEDGTRFKGIQEKTFSGFPDDATLVFDGDTAYCLMSRTTNAVNFQTGFVGTSRFPFTTWEWKETEATFSRPNLIRLADGKIIASVGLIGKEKSRTALCELDPATGKLKELLELPTDGKAIATGLVLHDGHLWVSYHVKKDGKASVYLTKVKVK